MPKGLESKTVEEQIRAIEDRNEARMKAASTEAARQQRTRREGLLLSRSRIVKDLEAARDERYQGLLQRSLAHLEDELAKIESSGSS